MVEVIADPAAVDFNDDPQRRSRPRDMICRTDEVEGKWPGLTKYLNAIGVWSDPHQMAGSIGTALMRCLRGVGKDRPNSSMTWQ
jgi:hypothetical protein